jgi:opacity protein-like surface antigen
MSHRRLVSLLALALAVACAAPAGALAQYYPVPPPPPAAAPAAPKHRTELTAIAGYQINTDVNTVEGSIRVGDAPVYGASISYETLPGAWAELLWLYSEPEVTVTGSLIAPGGSRMNVANHYFQIGGVKGVQRDRVTVFGGATIGAALFMPGTLHYQGGTSRSLSDTWRFAFTLGGGLKVDLSPRVALRFDAGVAAPVYVEGGGFYAGTGGSGMTVSGGIPFWQWNFLGGLVFRP